MSRKISCWGDLRQYGIEFLTGEACGLSMRVLCDFTERGRKLLGKAFGIPDFKGSENWNGGRKEDPHVGSIMLTHEFIPFLGIFALLESGFKEVFVFSLSKNDKDNPCCVPLGAPMAFSDEEEKAAYMDLAKRAGCGWRIYAYQGTAGDRNLHEMSGRVT